MSSFNRIYGRRIKPTRPFVYSFNKLQTLLVFILSFLCFVDFSNAQEWEYVVGDENDDIGYDVRQTADNGFIVTGIITVASDSIYYGTYVAKLDQFGNLEWSMNFEANNVNRFPAVTETLDGGFMLAGTSYNFGEIAKAHALKLTSDGQVEWYKPLYEDNHFRPSSIVVLADTTYVISGDFGGWPNIGTVSDDVLIMKFDHEGEVVWCQKHETVDEEKIRSIEAANNGGFILGGEIDIDFNDDLYMLKIDGYGSKEWEVHYGHEENGGLISEIGTNAISTPDGGFAYSGMERSFGNDWVVVKTDENGNELWATQIENDDVSGKNGGLIVNSIQGGIMIIGGGKFSQKLHFYHLSLNGQIEWQNSLELDDVHWPRRLGTTNDGGYVLTGSVGEFGFGEEHDLFVIVTDEFGTITSNTEIKLNAPKIKVYPNPALDYVTFETIGGDIKGRDLELKIYSPKGGLVLQKGFSSRLDIPVKGNLNGNGLYFYEVTDAAKKVNVGRFLVF